MSGASPPSIPEPRGPHRQFRLGPAGHAGPMKVVMGLYPCPEGGASDDLLGCAENALGLRGGLVGEGHELVATDAREGEELTSQLGEVEVLITTPFWPVYVDKDVFDAAPQLK